MIKLKGGNTLDNMTSEDLIELGIQSISTISESSFKPRIIFRYLNDEYEYVNVNENEKVDNKINDKINEIVRKKLIKKIRKEKLNQLK